MKNRETITKNARGREERNKERKNESVSERKEILKVRKERARGRKIIVEMVQLNEIILRTSIYDHINRWF